MPDTTPNVQQTVIGNNNIFSATGDVVVIQNPLPPAEARTRRELGILLQKVKTFWIAGFLEKSLYQMVLLDLGKEARPDAIDHPWESVLELPDQVGQAVARETKIIDIFDQVNRALLILGEPGSGKTTALVELARDLVIRSENDKEFGQAVPVIFNLSSWAEQRRPLIDWMVAELALKYQVPKQLGRAWLEENRLLPLLDGLDEVKAEYRSACIDAINIFGNTFGLAGLVVCSRLQEYIKLPVRLKLNGAISLQALTPMQIDAYLTQAGSRLVGLQAALAEDEELLTLAASPLILSVMALAYQDLTVDELTSKPASTVEERRRHLFDTYIERMFKRHGSGTQAYSPEQTTVWLAWLGQKMVQHKQSIFFIEGLQPAWLAERNTRRAYILLSRIVIVASYLLHSWFEGLFVGMGLGVLDIFRFERPERIAKKSKPVPEEPGPSQDSGSDMFVKTCARCGFKNHKSATQCVNCFTNLHWAKVNLGKFQGTEEDTKRIGMEYRKQHGLPATEASLPSPPQVSPGSDARNLRSIPFTTYLIWIVILRIFSFGLVHHGYADTGALVFVVISSFFLSLVLWWKSHLTNLSDEIQPAESVQWSWRQALTSCASLFVFLVIGAFLFTRNYTPVGTSLSGPLGLAVLCLSVLFVSLPFMLPAALRGGLKVKKVETKSYPNQGIWLSLKNTILMTAGFGTLTFITTLFVRLLSPSYQPDLLFVVLFFALWEGGLAVVQHYSLRLIFWRNKNMPWNYARFLDYAAERIFLRKVGGGYIFIHRLMMEHFAELGTTTEKI